MVSKDIKLHTIDEQLFKDIERKVKKENTIMPIPEIINKEKWIVDVSYGRSAIFLYEVGLKLIANKYSKSLKPNTKFRFIDERYGNPFLLTVASSKNLPKKFRAHLNLR